MGEEDLLPPEELIRKELEEEADDAPKPEELPPEELIRQEAAEEPESELWHSSQFFRTPRQDGVEAQPTELFRTRRQDAVDAPIQEELAPAVPEKSEPEEDTEESDEEYDEQDAISQLEMEAAEEIASEFGAPDEAIDTDPKRLH